jgi:hypothetical protein
MSRGQQITQQVDGMVLAGICFIGISFFAPDAGHHHNGSFFSIATSSAWGRPFELPAAWCSLKIMLSSIGLWLLIESFGTVLVRLKHIRLAVMLFALQIVPGVGLLTGGYYLAKSLF